jgi:hypothetical protein
VTGIKNCEQAEWRGEHMNATKSPALSESKKIKTASDIQHYN